MHRVTLVKLPHIFLLQFSVHSPYSLCIFSYQLHYTYIYIQCVLSVRLEKKLLPLFASKERKFENISFFLVFIIRSKSNFFRISVTIMFSKDIKIKTRYRNVAFKFLKFIFSIYEFCISST